MYVKLEIVTYGAKYRCGMGPGSTCGSNLWLRGKMTGETREGGGCREKPGPSAVKTPWTTGGCSPPNPVLQKHGKYTPLKKNAREKTQLQGCGDNQVQTRGPWGKRSCRASGSLWSWATTGAAPVGVQAGGDATSSLLGSSPWVQGGYFLFPVQAAVSAIRCNPGSIWTGLHVL